MAVEEEVISGAEIFKLMDTRGLPLEIINEELRIRGLAFNGVEFIEAALASKNFSYERIKERLVEAMLPQFRGEFELTLDEVARMKGWV